MAQLRAANSDLSSWPEDRVFEKIFSAFLFCDLHQAGTAALPANTKEMHKEVLTGKFVLQLDEVVNMAAAARERYSVEAGNRCLKLALTDGCQQVVGVEHTHLPAFTWDCPAGSKVLIHNVPVRRGLLLLGPDNTALLGGQVERLEAARQRAVAAWTKPVVGRPAGSAERDIFAEAREAAWPSGNPTGAQPQPAAGPGAAEAGTGTGTGTGLQGPPRSVQPQLQAVPGAGHVPPPGGPAGGPAGRTGPAATVILPQTRHQPQPVQLQHQLPGALAQQQHAAAGGSFRGLVAWGGPAAAAATGPSLQQQQQQPSSQGGAQVPSHQQAPQLQPPHQGWQPPQQLQQQPQQQPTQPQATTPPSQAAPRGGAPAGIPGLGRSANNTGFAAGEAGRPVRAVPAAAATYRAGLDSSTGVLVRGSATHPVELATSSDSDVGRSPPRAAQDPHLPPRQPQPQPQQQLPRRRLPSSVQGADLLGGSAAPAPGLGPSSSSSTGLLPPRPAAVQRAGTPNLAANAPGGGVAAARSASAAGAAPPGGAATAAALRKPALPLVRSSPGPSVSSLSSGVAGGGGPAAPSPCTSTASLHASNGLGVEAVRRPAVAGAAATGNGPADGPAMKVETVDLAALDDDDVSDEDGGRGRGGGGSSLGRDAGWAPGAAAAAAAAAAPPGDGGTGWRPQRGQGGKARLQPPIDQARREDKRPRLAAELRGCSGAEGAGRPAATAAAASEVVAGTEMDVDSPSAAGFHSAAAAAAPAPAPLPFDDDQHPPPDISAMQKDFGTAGGLYDLPAGWAGPDLDPDPAPLPDSPFVVLDGTGTAPAGGAVCGTAPPDPVLLEPDPGADADADNHAGSVLLCQVADLLQPGPDADIPLIFPMTVDVYGLFHRVEGDTAFIEDGTGLVEARLTTGALAPVLADAVPPDGFATDGPIGLDEIQAMVDSADPHVQAYGQELAERAMEFIRDFFGLIRLEYPAPLPAQPLIVRLTAEGESGVDGGAGLQGAGAGVNEGGSGCDLYEAHLREVGVLEAGGEDDGGQQCE